MSAMRRSLQYWHWLLIAILVLISLRVYMHSGFPYTHDGENHLARFANYKIAIRQGQFPPRFAPNLMNGYGYPVLNFNYPLANILSLPLSVLGFSYQTTFKIIVFCVLSLGAISLWQWLKVLDFSRAARFMALLIWLGSPFLVTAIVYRGSLGEIMAYGLLPPLFLLIDKRIGGHRYLLLGSIAWAAFFLSHNVTVFWTTPVVLAYFFVRKLSAKSQTISYKLFFFSLAISTGLVAWFWLPALAESSSTVLSQASNTKDFIFHFPTLKQLFIAENIFGFSYPGSVDSLPFQLGMFPWLTLFIVPVLWVRRRKLSLFGSNNALLLFFWFCSLFFICLQLAASQYFWLIMPGFRFIQFPWRLALILPLSSLVPLGYLFESTGKWTKLIFSVVALFSWVYFTSLTPIEYLHQPYLYYDQFPMSTSTQNENLPRSFTYENIGENSRKPTITDEFTTYQIDSWNGSVRKYAVAVTTNEPVTVIEPTANFPGWQTKVNGFKTTYIDNPDVGGRIAFTLQGQGVHSIETKFTQKTVARRVGNVVSLFCAVWLFFFALIVVKWKSHEA